MYASSESAVELAAVPGTDGSSASFFDTCKGGWDASCGGLRRRGAGAVQGSDAFDVLSVDVLHRCSDGRAGRARGARGVTWWGMV